MSTGVQQPSARLCFFTTGLLCLEITAIVSVMLTATDIQGADLSEPLVLFWHSHRRCLEQTPDSDPQLALIHPRHAKPSHSPISIAWKSVEGGARILGRVVVTTCYIYPGVLCRSQSYLSRSPAYHCGHLNCVIGIVIANARFKPPTC